MTRIKDTFENLKEKGERALVGFVTAGDPDPDTSLKVIRAMIRGGTDILELGVPFSDPTADGPVIQRSSGRALEAGMNLDKVLEMTRSIREETDIPIVIFSYYNPILAHGLEKFYTDFTQAGADGLLVVDLPPEEAGEMTDTWPGEDLDLIRLVAPTTPRERMEMIAQRSSGFLYLVSMTGVTGSAGLDLDEVSRVFGELRGITRLPIAVGFGISTPEQAASVADIADGVVVGSAFERLIEENTSAPDLDQMVLAYTRAMKEATVVLL